MNYCITHFILQQQNNAYSVIVIEMKLAHCESSWLCVFVCVCTCVHMLSVSLFQKVSWYKIDHFKHLFNYHHFVQWITSSLVRLAREVQAPSVLSAQPVGSRACVHVHLYMAAGHLYAAAYYCITNILPPKPFCLNTGIWILKHFFKVFLWNLINVNGSDVLFPYKQLTSLKPLEWSIWSFFFSDSHRIER